MNNLNILQSKCNATIAVVVAYCVSVLAGCGTGNAPNTAAPAAETYAAPPPPPADSMHLLDSTYQRVHALFTDNFDAGEGAPLLLTRPEVPYDTLLLLAPTDTGKHALHIDYGLSGDSIRLAFCVVQLAPTADPARFSYTVGTTVHDWNNGHLTPFDRAQWRTRYQYDTANTNVYYSKVRVRRSARSPFIPLDPLTDAGADVLAWEDEVVELYNQNSRMHEDSTFHMVFSCIGRIDERDVLRHGMALHLRVRPERNPGAGYRDLLDNSYDPAQLLLMHGADFGSMNPPGNGYYDLPPQ